MKVWPITGRVLQPQPDIIAQYPLAAQCVSYRELRFTKHFPKRLWIECQAYYCVTLKSKHFFYIHGLRQRVFSLPASLLLVAVDLLALYGTLFPCVYTVELVRLVGAVKLSTDWVDIWSCTDTLQASQSNIHRFLENIIVTHICPIKCKIHTTIFYPHTRCFLLLSSVF